LRRPRLSRRTGKGDNSVNLFFDPSQRFAGNKFTPSVEHAYAFGINAASAGL
jgi:hypothetical protein